MSQPVGDAIPLSNVLADACGLTPADATLRFAGRVSVILNRLWMHAWPYWFVAGIGLFALLARAARRDRLDFTVGALVVVGVIMIPVLVAMAKGVVISHGSQLCLVALPAEAIALLGVNYRGDLKDGGGSIPRHPLMASEAGLSVDINGQHAQLSMLRDRGIVVAFTATRGGLLSHCVLCKGDRRVPVRVRGRLRLKP